MIHALRLVLLLAATLVAAAAHAALPGEAVDNFRLIDHRGESHELRYYSDARAIVLVVHGNGCPIVRKSLPVLAELRKRYASQGVEFLMLDSNLQDDRDSIAREATELGIDLPILVDGTQLVGEALGVTRTADAFVVDPKTWKLVYRGPIDDRLSYGTERPPSRHFLADALDALLAAKPVETAQAEAVGCIVNFPERDRREAHVKISYSERIAPLLIDRCVACHRDGGVAPWAMDSYRKIQGFAPMIREVLRTQRMPPWHADPHYGTFVGQRSMGEDDVKTLVHWIEAGAPRGSGPDPLEKAAPTNGEWTLGKPHLVIEVPAFEVPATGVVQYRYPFADNPLGRDVWVRAIEILPGDRTVVHHVLAGIDDPANGSKREIAGKIGELGGYAPGKNAVPYPADTGILLRKEARFRFQMHYTPSGKPTRDVTRLGLWFYDKPPKHALDMLLVYDASFAIPANTKLYARTIEHTFERDIMLYSLLPHFHLRGRSAKFTAHFPDGRTEILLSVPHYDFNWQPLYALDPPRYVPAGTRVVLDMTWDNSAQNPANPDPTKVVRWGDQTWEEMNLGWFRFRLADDADRAHARAEASAPHSSVVPPGGETRSN